jgi:phage shock protein PspC (stress-responsive transcriptional regulator)
MSETQGPSTTAEEQNTADAQQPGIDRQNLRNYEQLRRSVTDRKIAGVAGGLGRHLNIDPTILRVLFVVLCFFGGAGFLLYGAAWLLVPEDGRTDAAVATNPSTRNALLIGAGVVAALLLVGDSWGGIGFPWPLLLVGVGVLLYLAFRDQGSRTPAQPAQPSYAPGYGPTGQPDPAYDPDAGMLSGPPAPPWMAAPAATPAHQPQPRAKRGPKLFGLTLALVAVALGSLGLYDVSGGAVLDSAYPALALAVVGVMLVVGAFVGRPGGLILLGLVAAVALMATSIAGTFGAMDFRDGDSLSVAPTSASSVRSDYHVDSGRVFVDLSGVSDPEQLDGRVIEVSANAGELVVILPDGVESEVQAAIDGPGQIDLPGRSSGGISTDITGTYGQGDATVIFDTHLSAGHIDVRNP